MRAIKVATVNGLSILTSVTTVATIDGIGGASIIMALFHSGNNGNTITPAVVGLRTQTADVPTAHGITLIGAAGAVNNAGGRIFRIIELLTLPGGVEQAIPYTIDKIRLSAAATGSTTTASCDIWAYYQDNFESEVTGFRLSL